MPTLKTEIPHTIPTREEIAELGRREPIVGLTLEQFRRGDINYEDALRLSVAHLADMLNQATTPPTSTEIVYLNRDEDPPRPSPRSLSVELLYEFAVPFLIGLGFVFLFNLYRWGTL